ncbi:hypothetical protein KXV85_004959, partial [Aspergillus fumigatus]
AGSPCAQPFWGCLDCPNAVITARKLPAILAFLAFVEEQRLSLPATDWAANFGRVHARITAQVLPAFSDAVIADARRQMESERLYLPPEAPAFDDRPVLASAPLKEGHIREELSRVGDPSWDLGPAVFRENARRCHVTVHFDVLEHADVQAAMRAYLYARLN